MTLIFSKVKSLEERLNRSLVKIEKNLWLGSLTIREQDMIKSMIPQEEKGSVLFFNVSSKNLDKNIRNVFDICSKL